jgi:CRISPR-associated protein Cst2
MTFVTGALLIDAPASALNNSGEPIPNARTDNTAAVKFIRANDGKTYPYVSAQAVRYWIRRSLEKLPAEQWKAAPIKRDDKVAYTDGNPIEWWDDDIFGYMRAPAKEGQNRASGKKNAVPLELPTPAGVDKKGDAKAITRAAPLRISTFVSIAPVNITNDFGVMARQQGDPAPFEHQFYRTTLLGLFSLDLSMAGKFFYSPRSGYQNLDVYRVKLAQEKNLEHREAELAYRLPLAERLLRVNAVLNALSDMQGGAKQSIHYTDVTPAVVVCAVTRGGNHPFQYLFQEQRGVLQFQEDVLINSLADMKGQLLSPVYIGWKHGFSPEARQCAMRLAQDQPKNGARDEDNSESSQPVKTDDKLDKPFETGTPRAVLDSLTKWLGTNAAKWDD